MARLRNRKGTFFFKYFFIFSAVILVSFLILGLSLSIFMLNYFRASLMNDVSGYAENIAATTAGVLGSDLTRTDPKGAAVSLYNAVDVLGKSSGCDVFLCGKDGTVVVCTDAAADMAHFDVDACPRHAGFMLSELYLDRVKRGGLTEISKLNGLYDELNAVALRPITTSDGFVGAAVVASPVSSHFAGPIREVLLMFLLSSGIALLMMTAVVYVTTERIAKPIRDLETATRLYTEGDFSYRVPELDTHDELADLITKFNSMAVSLSELEDSRRNFVANVSHEFKTPMTTIGGFINGILDGTIPAEKQPYYLGIVSSEIKRLSRMVNMMLNISRIETGNVDLKIERCNLTDKLIQTLLGFEQLISGKHIDVEGLDALQPLPVRGDSAMLDQVVYNLVDNAVKFTDEGGRIVVNTAEDKRYAYFSVTNSGKGISEQDLSKIFERFYKVDRSRSTDVKSTGLGLYLVKSIVELHGGTVTAESEPNLFTRFTVRLPK